MEALSLQKNGKDCRTSLWQMNGMRNERTQQVTRSLLRDRNASPVSRRSLLFFADDAWMGPSYSSLNLGKTYRLLDCLVTYHADRCI